VIAFDHERAFAGKLDVFDIHWKLVSRKAAKFAKREIFTTENTEVTEFMIRN
jgi:hypothetical protein